MRFRYQAWSSATAFVVGDIQQTATGTYRCILNHSNHVPPNPTYWEKYSDVRAAEILFDIATSTTSQAINFVTQTNGVEPVVGDCVAIILTVNHATVFFDVEDFGIPDGWDAFPLSKIQKLGKFQTSILIYTLSLPALSDTFGIPAGLTPFVSGDSTRAWLYGWVWHTDAVGSWAFDKTLAHSAIATDGTGEIDVDIDGDELIESFQTILFAWAAQATAFGSTSAVPWGQTSDTIDCNVAIGSGAKFKRNSAYRESPGEGDSYSAAVSFITSDDATEGNIDGAVFYFVPFIPNSGKAALTGDSVTTPVHTFVNKRGQASQPIVGDFRMTESAIEGGPISCSGTITREEYDKYPDLFNLGADWYIFSQEDEELLYVGELNEPSPGEADVDITSRGEAFERLRHTVDRLNYQDRSYEPWTNDDSDLHGQGVSPERAPNVALGGAGSIENGVHRYKITFVSADGETRPSPRSDEVDSTGMGAHKILLTRIPQGPGWCVARRIYRTTASGSSYGFVDEIGNFNDENDYEDNLSDDDLGDAPPDQYSPNEIQVDVGQAKLNYRVPRGASITQLQQKGLVYWNVDQRIRRLAFRVNQSRESDNYLLEVYIGNGPDGEMQLWQQFNLDGTGDPLKDMTFDFWADMIRIGLIRSGDTAENAQPIHAWLTKVRVNGIALDDEMSDAALVRDICARTGIPDTLVEPSGENILPLVIVNNPYRSAVDYAQLLADRRAILVPHGMNMVMDYDEWERRLWVLVDPEVKPEYIGLPRRNVGAVPFQYADGKAESVSHKRADPDPFPGDDRIADPISFSNPIKKSLANRLSHQQADYLAQERMGGTVTFSEILDSSGMRVSHWRVKAGDCVYDPWSGLTLRIGEIERSMFKSTARFVESYGNVERMVARQNQKQALSGKASVL